MTQKKAIVFLSILLLVFIVAPTFVIYRTIALKSGWNGIRWESSMAQVKKWIKKNNTNYRYEVCDKSHFGILCYKLSWREKNHSSLEFIEFQFKNDKLCAVIETKKPTQTNPATSLNLGQAEFARDVRTFFSREKGIKFLYTERNRYYSPSNIFKTTKKRYAVTVLERKIPADETFADEAVLFRLTEGYYESAYFDTIKDKIDDFPSSELH